VTLASARVGTKASVEEVPRTARSEDASTETAVSFGWLMRMGEEFKFKSVGHGFAGGLKPLAEAHGVAIG
ncbi:chemical-damaging agent resistance protein C, partial [Pseudomonas syringae]